MATLSSHQRPVQKSFCRFNTQLLVGTVPFSPSICSAGNIFYSVITVTSFRVKLLCKSIFKCTKLNRFRNNVQLCYKTDLLVFCSSTCHANLVCAVKHFIVTFFVNDLFVLVTFMARTIPFVSTYFK